MRIRIHWGIAVAMFYTLFALSTVGFVVFAMTQDVELVSADYYARGLQHDVHMQAVANADAIDRDLRVEVRAGAGDVIVHWPAAMAPLVRGTATLYRPADARADRVVPLVPGADGTQAVSTAGLARGHWRLQLQWRVDERDYYTERDVRLP
jgi:hypothetical protein